MEEFLIGMGIVAIYFIIAASTVLLCRKLFKIPNEIFRKILHFILLGSALVFVYAFKNWWIAVIACIVFVVIVYPILMCLERIKKYSEFVTERKKGELKNSLIFVFLMFAIVISICFGIFKDRLLALASIYAWGFGDALATLIGTKFGKHKLYKKKSYEGTIAMFITAFVSVFVILLIRGNVPWYFVCLVSFVTALSSAATELFTPNGYDTITCPIASMISMLLALFICGGLV